MASNTKLFPKTTDQKDEMEVEITEILKSGPNNQVFKPELEDDQKRWLIVGICLQNIVTPTLRKFAEPNVIQLYNTMKNTYGIDNQMYPNYLKTYQPTKNSLNYDAINGNRSKHGKRLSKFDFNVVNHTDFSKLFMITSMTHYSGFDETCDLSSILGIIINLDNFQSPVQNVSKQLRSDVRNPWAHCNFGEWDTIKYQMSFQLMHQLIRCLHLNAADEVRLLDEITKWETNGFTFLQGYAVGLDMVKELRRQTHVLAEYAQKRKTDVGSTFDIIHDVLVKFEVDINKTGEILDQLNSDQHLDKQSVEQLHCEVGTIQNKMTELGTVQLHHEVDMQRIFSDVNNLTVQANKMSVQNNSNSNRLEDLEGASEKVNNEIKNIHTNITEIRADIDQFQNYMSTTKPNEKIFFYPPNRPRYFVAREKELEQLKQDFIHNSQNQHTQVVCGLGGCGKTTLAIEFAWRSQEFYQGGVFWVSAESEDSLNDSITSLAIDVNSNGSNSTETLKRTLSWLSGLTDRWLLVVDNADEKNLSKHVKELLMGTWKRGTLGHVLITTRREPIDVEESLYFERDLCVELNVFDKKSSMEFLKYRTGFDLNNDDENVVLLVDELGGLPLALEQAASHIKVTKCSFHDYFKRFKKKRIKFFKAASSSFPIDRARLSVSTTWQLNIDYISKQSSEEGLGKAAILLMEISSYLYADEIPLLIFNTGYPSVDDEDVIEALEDDMGMHQIVSILTRFSLFQCRHENALSIHRLVQEIIRNGMKEDHKRFILQCSTRMVNKALSSTKSPYDVTSGKSVSKRTSLLTWNKLAANATIMKEHIVSISKNKQHGENLMFNEEMLQILQTTAVYHSFYQRQAKALEDQEQMVHIMTALAVSEEKFRYFTTIKIPLFPKDRILIHESLTSNMKIVLAEGFKETPIVQYDPETLRIKGNDCFKEKKYHDALWYYTEAIKKSPADEIDYRIYSNRSLTYLQIKNYERSLEDANKSIEKAPGHWKGYCWKAYAIAGLTEKENMPSVMDSVGLASACIAAYLQPTCLLEYKMIMGYPVINYKMIDMSDNLAREMTRMDERPFTTLLLRKGRYHLLTVAITTKSIQIVGIENGVEIDIKQGLCISRCPKETLLIDIEPEEVIYAHFENVNFIEGGMQITVTNNSVGTFYQCKFSNGGKGCEDIPYCKQDQGCINPLNCKRASLGYTKGLPGYAGICVSKGGKAYFDNCILDRCGGGGVLSSGDRSLIDIKRSVIRNMRQTGIEARDGGSVTAIKNTIITNQLHGVAIGPRGIGYLSGNTIQGNGCEGMWCGGTLYDSVGIIPLMNMNEGSRAVIIDNNIGQNGMSGISFDGGTYEVRGNKIFDNWLWGLIIKSRSSAYVLDNEVFENKCGGIRIGVNYSAMVVIDGNTIRDHSGADIYVVNKLISSTDVGDGETMGHTRVPMITSTNVRRNNGKGIQHPTNMEGLIQTCCFCHDSARQLKSCSKCIKAKYCSKECQANHWIRHKNMCKLLRASYIIEIEMKKTKRKNQELPQEMLRNFAVLRHFSGSLIGLGEGSPPDKRSTNRFIVKIQSGKEYTRYDPNQLLIVYDKSVSLDIQFANPILYHLCCECGILANEFTRKTIFCWASFKNNGRILCFHTDNLPPFQTW